MKIQPTFRLPGTFPLALSKTMIKRIEEAVESQRNLYSATGGTLWVGIEYAERNGISYTLRRPELGGWVLELGPVRAEFQ